MNFKDSQLEYNLFCEHICYAHSYLGEIIDFYHFLLQDSSNNKNFLYEIEANLLYLEKFY